MEIERARGLFEVVHDDQGTRAAGYLAHEIGHRCKHRPAVVQIRGLHTTRVDVVQRIEDQQLRRPLSQGSSDVLDELHRPQSGPVVRRIELNALARLAHEAVSVADLLKPQLELIATTLGGHIHNSPVVYLELIQIPAVRRGDSHRQHQS